jgi:zinc-ribbon domain
MKCRQCGTEIAEKALICFKCGTAVNEPVHQPYALPTKRRPVMVYVVFALIVLVALLALLMR